MENEENTCCAREGYIYIYIIYHYWKNMKRPTFQKSHDVDHSVYIVPLFWDGILKIERTSVFLTQVIPFIYLKRSYSMHRWILNVCLFGTFLTTCSRFASCILQHLPKLFLYSVIQQQGRNINTYMY